MISIGLLNHAQYYDELQDTLLMEMEFDCDDLNSSYNEVQSGEKHSLDSDYWSLLPDVDQPIFEFWSTVESASTAVPNSTEGASDYTPPSSPSSSGRGCEQGHQAPFTASRSHDGSNIASMSGPPVQDVAAKIQPRPGQDRSPDTGAASDGRVSKRNSRVEKSRRPDRPRADKSSGIVEIYFDEEGKKDIGSQGRACIVNVMKAYQTGIRKAPATSQPALAVLATSVGDSSALLLLKEAIHGLRSPQMRECLCVDQEMSIPERIVVIEQVGACSALFRLVRLLHIVTLWEDLSRRAEDGSDCFVNLTPGSSFQPSTRRGNPLNLARNEVTQGLSAAQGLQTESPQDDRARKNTRLRRLGERLGLIVRTWGQGALLIFGQELTESKIMASTDKAFKAFIALIDQVEGARISAVSAAALPIHEEFRRGNRSAAILRVESADEDAILNIPRLSTDFENLLHPSGAT